LKFAAAIWLILVFRSVLAGRRAAICWWKSELTRHILWQEAKIRASPLSSSNGDRRKQFWGHLGGGGGGGGGVLYFGGGVF
jgi:hypothetical protein